MDRLQTELARLYIDHDPQPGRTRALLLEVRSPGGWRELSQAWRDVQADLQLPAPAIAVSGRDGLQLWFSLAEPTDEPRAMAFLEGLRRRYLGGLPAPLVRMVPVPAALDPAAPQAVPLPPHRVASDRWSVFVAHDLASLFEDERWLDQPADVDAQSDLLCRLETTKPGAFTQALSLLGHTPPAPAPAPAAGRQPPRHTGPREFLLEVMNDPSVDMALRIEAARALLSAPSGDQRPSE